MYCIHCGRENGDDADFCYHCGARTRHEPGSAATGATLAASGAAAAPAPALAEPGIIDAAPTDTPPTESEPATAPLVYAGVWERLLAFAVDLLVFYCAAFLVGLVLILIGQSGASDASLNVWSVIGFVVYMSIADAGWSTTVGKWTFGMIVARERVNPAVHKLSLGRAIWRETAGRFAGFFFFCVGYWNANSKPQRQAWTDSVAGSVVIQSRPARRFAFPLAMLGLVVVVGTRVWSMSEEVRASERATLLTEIDSAGSAVQTARENVTQIENRNPQSVADFQASMSDLEPALDTYDAAMKHFTDLVSSGFTSGVYTSSDRTAMRNLMVAMALRQDESATLRKEAELVVAYNPAQGTWSAVQQDLQMLDSDIHADEVKLAPLLRAIGPSHGSQP